MLKLHFVLLRRKWFSWRRQSSHLFAEIICRNNHAHSPGFFLLDKPTGLSIGFCWLRSPAQRGFSTSVNSWQTTTHLHPIVVRLNQFQHRTPKREHAWLNSEEIGFKVARFCWISCARKARNFFSTRLFIGLSSAGTSREIFICSFPSSRNKFKPAANPQCGDRA